MGMLRLKKVHMQSRICKTQSLFSLKSTKFYKYFYCVLNFLLTRLNVWIGNVYDGQVLIA